jgi:hypothetical protein
MNEQTKYNGWKNRETWNCALWINNDYSLYKAAVEFMKSYKGKAPYMNFIKHMGMEADKTGDNIKWLSNRLDYKELNAMMKDLP